MANELYTAREIACMTSDALDELMSHYSCTGNTEGVALVQAEIDTRFEDEQAAEVAWQAEQDERERAHYEMLESQGIFI